MFDLTVFMNTIISPRQTSPQAWRSVLAPQARALSWSGENTDPLGAASDLFVARSDAATSSSSLGINLTLRDARCRQHHIAKSADRPQRVNIEIDIFMCITIAIDSPVSPSNMPVLGRTLRSHTPAAALTVLLFGLLASSAAFAQGVGTLMVRVGATKVVPRVTSDDLTPAPVAGVKADLESNTQPSVSITYMLTDNISIDVPIAVPFKINVIGAGIASGAGRLGDVRGAPVTVLGQYRFRPAQAAFRPYVGAGLTYAKFYGAHSADTLNALTGGTPTTPTMFSIDSKFAATVQLGGTYAVGRWFADANLTRTYLRSRATFSTGQTLEARLDPMTFAVSVGYLF